MNILIVSQYYWPEPFRITDLAAGLMERGHRVTVLTGKPNYPGGKIYDRYNRFSVSRERYEGVKIVRIPSIPRGSGGSLRLILNYLSFALSASLLGPISRLGRFDLIFVYEPSPITVGIPAVVLKTLRRKPILFWVQDLWPESLSATGAVHSPRALTLVSRLVSYIYNRCDLILVQSKAFKDPVRKLCSDNDTSRVRYFPNTAEALYRPVQLPDNCHDRALIPPGFIVMFAGSLGEAQDFPTLLTTAEKLRKFPNIHWVVIGDGRLSDWLKQEIEQRNLSNRIHMLGRLPKEKMPGLFSLADVMLVSLKNEPIFSLTIPAKIQSYLACARPILGSLAGEGARVIEEAGAGLAVPPGEPEHLVDALLKFYRMSPEQREILGRAGRAYFLEHFEREYLLGELDAWIKEMCTTS